MSASAFAPSMNDITVLGLDIRNKEAEKIIAQYAKNHRWLDVAVGAAGTLVPVPGAALVAMVACIAAQGPLFYKPMADKLAKVYLGSIDHHTNRLVIEGVFEGAGLDIANEFNAQFFAEIAGELVSELGWGGAVAMVPFIGGIAGAALDALVATTMTWRVGTMISVYFQNGGQWLGSRRETFEVAKDFVGPLSAKAENRVDLNEIGKKNSQVMQHQLNTLKSVVIDPLLEVGASKEQILASLRKRGINEDMIEASISYIRSELDKSGA
jgi:hypothetical protein